jgi:hypothetical protein
MEKPGVETLIKYESGFIVTEIAEALLQFRLCQLSVRVWYWLSAEAHLILWTVSTKIPQLALTSEVRTITGNKHTGNCTVEIFQSLLMSYI